MASRAARGAHGAGGLNASGENRAGATAPSFSLLFRAALVVVVLMLAGYVLLAGSRFTSAAAPADLEARTAAQLLAARLQARLAGLSVASEFGAQLLKANPDEPRDAADQTLHYAHSDAKGVAILNGDHVLAALGDAKDATWTAAAKAGREAGGEVWVGAPLPSADAGGSAGRSRFAYLVRPISTSAGPLSLVLALDLEGLLPDLKGRLSLVSGKNGAIVAAQGLSAAKTEFAALGLGPASVTSAIASGRAIDAALGQDSKARLFFTATPDNNLIVAVEAPSASARGRSLIANMFSLFAPVLIGAILIILLILQTRKADAAAAQRSESERKFRMAVEAARCGIWEWRLRDEQVYLSDVTGVMLGWGGGGVVSTEDVVSHIAPEHQDRLRQALRSAGTFGALDVSFCVPRASGGFAWIDARGQAFGEPDALGYATLIGVALDVTEERVVELRAQAAERRLHDAIDSVSEAFVLWDRQGRLLMCNANFRAFFMLEPGVVKPGVSRKSVQELADLAVRRHGPSLDGQRGVREVELVDGRWLQISERRTADGGMVMTAADVTAIKRQEEARRRNEEALEKAVARLEESQRNLTELAQKYQEEKMRAESANTAKSEFLANMSHELRTPLNAINGFSEIMFHEMFGPLGDHRYKEYAQDILGSGQHLLALINDILDMSKIEAGKMNLNLDWMDVGDVVDDVVRLMRNRVEAASLVLSTSLPPGLPEIEGDYRAIKQILLNLISNAVKFTPTGGRVEVKVWSTGEETSAHQLCVAVTDTGIGIAKEEIGRLARPFEQIETKHAKAQAGTGLGLALTKSLVELHGGRFELDSEPGRGTTASFTLPVKRQRRAKSSPHTISKAVA